MDPVQKAVINHTFGVPLVKTKRPVISCNVCQIRFNSEVQENNNNAHTEQCTLSISHKVSTYRAELNILHPVVYTQTPSPCTQILQECVSELTQGMLCICLGCVLAVVTPLEFNLFPLESRV